MARYIPRLKGVEAFQLPAEDDDDMDPFHEWAESVGFVDFTSERDGTMRLPVDGEEYIACPGDWIVKGPQGYFVVEPGLFAKVYRAAMRLEEQEECAASQ